METESTPSMQDAIKQEYFPADTEKTVDENTTETETVVEEEKKTDPDAPVVVIDAPVVVEEDGKEKVPAFDETAWIKQHFGEDVDSIDTLKGKLQAPKAPTFENETSKKIYEALLSGKESEVTEFLVKKQFAASLKDKPAEEIIKAGWKNEYGLTDVEADRRYQKRFSVTDDEYLDDVEKGIEAKLMAKDIQKEADRYKTFFAEYEQNINLPQIEQEQAQAPTVDYTSEAAKQAIAFSEQLNTPIEDLVNIPFELDDTNLKIKGKVAIPATKVESIKTQLKGHEDKFIESRWFKDGQFNADLFARDVYLLTNYPNVINATAAQVAHKARLELLKENRNYQDAGKVISGDFMPTEDEQKREWYRKYMM